MSDEVILRQRLIEAWRRLEKEQKQTVLDLVESMAKVQIQIDQQKEINKQRRNTNVGK